MLFTMIESNKLICMSINIHRGTETEKKKYSRLGWNREKLYTMEGDGPSTMTYRCSEIIRERERKRKTHRYKLWMDSEKEHGGGIGRKEIPSFVAYIRSKLMMMRDARIGTIECYILSFPYVRSLPLLSLVRSLPVAVKHQS